jgi:hypothetical protein
LSYCKWPPPLGTAKMIKYENRIQWQVIGHQ